MAAAGVLAAAAVAGQSPCTAAALGADFNGEVMVMGTFDGGGGPALYAAGAFSANGGVPVGGIARWDGAAWSPLGAGTNGVVRCLVVHDDGSGPSLFAGGSFTAAGGQPCANVARWTGAAWAPVGGGLPALQYLADFAVHDDGTGAALYAGGLSPVESVHRWNGAAWSPAGPGVHGNVLGLRSFDAGGGPALLLACGQVLTNPGSVYAGAIASWDGSAWGPFSPPLFGLIYDLAVADLGSGPMLFAGARHVDWGSVTQYGGMLRLDGGTWTYAGTSPNNEFVTRLGVFDDGTGPAIFAGLQSQGAKWDGSAWTPLVGPAFPVAARSFWVFDHGFGPDLHAAGWPRVLRLTCPATISVHISQPDGAGTAVYGSNLNLTPGGEYFNLVSVTPCPAGAGAGPVLGLCIDPAFLAMYGTLPVVEVPGQLPVDANPFHFRATSPLVIWGPFARYLPPTTIDVLCLEVGAAGLGAISPVTRFTVH